MSRTSGARCTAPWLPSTSTGTPRSWAMRQTSFTGTTVPSTFDMWVTATNLVFGDSACSNRSMSNEPSSRTCTHLSTAPRRSRRKCHGTTFEWCSMIVSTISSPGSMPARPTPFATRLIDSVAERVKMISSVEAAFRNARTLSRPPSNPSVAAFAR